MPQEDRLKKEIDRIGKVLGKLLADMLALKGANAITNASGVLRQVLREELQQDPDALMSLPADTVIKMLRDKRWGDAEIEALAGIWEVVPDNDDARYKHMALALYNALAKESRTFSFTREAKIQRLTADLGAS